MRINNINSLLNLKDIFVRDVKVSNEIIKIHAESKKKAQICPICGNKTWANDKVRKRVQKSLPSKLFNNNIKVLKRNAFGFRNFDNFRTRILYCCSDK